MAKKFITISLILFVVVLGGLFLKSCGTDTWREFEIQVNEFSADDTISVEEWDELLTYVTLHIRDRAFGRFLTDKSFDEQKLRTYLEKRNLVIEEPKPHQPKTVNIYIENSGSMFGFVSGNTGFKNALTQLVSELKSHYDEGNIKFHFINKQITPLSITGDIAYYPKTLSNIGDKHSGDSDINEIFRQVLENTHETSVSILLSDCVYSVGKDVKNNDVNGALKLQKSLTADRFTNTINDKGFSTLFAQLVSNFNGTYYTKDNSKVQLTGQQIAYYMTVVGSDAEIEKFDFVKKLDGYRNQMILTTQNYSENAFYSLIRTNADNGDYKPTRNRNSSPEAVQAIEGIRFRGRGENTLVFSLAVDFNKLPVDENYMLDASNYAIEKGDYEIVSISPFEASQVQPNVLTRLEQNHQNPTHLIVFESTANLYNDLVFSLKKNIPDWIYSWSTNDDSDIKANPDQTFGLTYLVEGIFEAYQSSSPNEDYITFTIQIKK